MGKLWPPSTFLSLDLPASQIDANRSTYTKNHRRNTHSLAHTPPSLSQFAHAALTCHEFFQAANFRAPLYSAFFFSMSLSRFICHDFMYAAYAPPATLFSAMRHNTIHTACKELKQHQPPGNRDGPMKLIFFPASTPPPPPHSFSSPCSPTTSDKRHAGWGRGGGWGQLDTKPTYTPRHSVANGHGSASSLGRGRVELRRRFLVSPLPPSQRLALPCPTSLLMLRQDSTRRQSAAHAKIEFPALFRAMEQALYPKLRYHTFSLSLFLSLFLSRITHPVCFYQQQ